jgi:hypothetical protein
MNDEFDEAKEEDQRNDESDGGCRPAGLSVRGTGPALGLGIYPASNA